MRPALLALALLACVDQQDLVDQAGRECRAVLNDTLPVFALQITSAAIEVCGGLDNHIEDVRGAVLLYLGCRWEDEPGRWNCDGAMARACLGGVADGGTP